MKKIIFSIFIILTITICGASVFAGETENLAPIDQNIIVESDTESGEANHTKKEELNGASEEILGAVTEKDRKIAELSDKYNDKTLGTVAYYLELVRYYSTPVFFIFLTIGAFNFFIIGNKKLDKKEQGFGWITACIIGWVFFQCIPLIFALFAI